MKKGLDFLAPQCDYLAMQNEATLAATEMDWLPASDSRLCEAYIVAAHDGLTVVEFDPAGEDFTRRDAWWVSEPGCASWAVYSGVPMDEPMEDHCTSRTGHEWSYSGTQYGGDDERWGGEGRVLCVHCGADGDA